MNEDQNRDVEATLSSVINLFLGKAFDNKDIKQLSIPYYQRPYVWEEEQVLELLNDICLSYNMSNRERYRIGSVILHEAEKEKLDIVDGQQRLTTLFILLNSLGVDLKEVGKHFCFNHIESKRHIIENSETIEAWINENFLTEKKNDFARYVQTECEFVVIKVKELAEAFQMFESQNGRGKDLEAYNLLKAYHIRAMENDSQSEKIKCDSRWESTATTLISPRYSIDLLKQVIDEQLYRSRLWIRSESAGKFSKKKIGEFKGFTINTPVEYPYQKVLFTLWDKILTSNDVFINQYSNRFKADDYNNISQLMSINQPIINGRLFFLYIETYVQRYKKLFINLHPTYLDSEEIREFKRFYYCYCLHYESNRDLKNLNLDSQHLYYQDVDLRLSQEDACLEKASACRTGDTYLREFYKSAIIVLFDRFGEKGLIKYYKLLYRLIYLKRFQFSHVRYNSVDDFVQTYSLFRIITNAKEIGELRILNKHFLELLNQVKKKDDNFRDRIYKSIGETKSNFCVDWHIFNMVRGED